MVLDVTTDGDRLFKCGTVKWGNRNQGITVTMSGTYSIGSYMMTWWFSTYLPPHVLVL